MRFSCLTRAKTPKKSRGLQANYQEDAMAEWTCEPRCAKFIEGYRSLQNLPRTGRPQILYRQSLNAADNLWVLSGDTTWYHLKPHDITWNHLISPYIWYIAMESFQCYFFFIKIRKNNIEKGNADISKIEINNIDYWGNRR